MTRSRDLRNLFISLSLAAGVFAVPAYSQITINIGTPPPPLRQEVVPTLQPGYVWAPGYWGWNGDRHVWVRGRPIAQREGYLWQADRWEDRGGKYYRTAGHWERDNDHEKWKNKKWKDDDHDKGWHKGEKGDKHRG